MLIAMIAVYLRRGGVRGRSESWRRKSWSVLFGRFAELAADSTICGDVVGRIPGAWVEFALGRHIDQKLFFNTPFD